MNILLCYETDSKQTKNPDKIQTCLCLLKIFLKKNLLIQKSQTFVQNEGVWEGNLQSSLRIEESLEKRGFIDPRFCFYVNSIEFNLRMAYHKKVFVPWCSFLYDCLVLSQERRTEEPVGQEELFRVIQLLMDKARAYTVTNCKDKMPKI
jgi:hypothetical protein